MVSCFCNHLTADLLQTHISCLEDEDGQSLESAGRRAGIGQPGRHLVEEALVVEGLPGGAHVGLPKRDLLADVALAVARQLALLVPVRVLGLQPPLALALPPPLFSARSHAWGQ